MFGALGERADLLRALGRCERAHRVDEHGADAWRDRIEQARLQRGEARDVGGSQAPLRVGVTAEHAEAGARRVDDDEVVALIQVRARVEHVQSARLDAGEAEPRGGVGEQIELAARLVGSVDRRGVVGELGEVRGLAADAGARVEDVHAGARRRHVADELRAGVLDGPLPGEERRAAPGIADAFDA